MITGISREDLMILVQQLGPTWTAIASGTRDRSLAERWASGEEAPTAEEALKLSVAYEVFNEVAQTEGADTARAWFIGRSVGDHEVSPGEAIREGNFNGAYASAKRMINGEMGY
jgi:hypothetical protein